MANNHYIPRLVLRNFAEEVSLYESGEDISYSKKHSHRINIYNVKTKKIEHNKKIDDVYSEKNLYNNELERKFNVRLESQFGSFFNNILKKKDNEIILKRRELMLIKKFLMISILRVKNGASYLRFEKDLRTNISIDALIDTLVKYSKITGIETSKEKAQEIANNMKNDKNEKYKETVIENETDEEYWYRTLNVILDTDGSSEKIKEHPLVTSSAIRWSLVVEAGYLAFWDSYRKNDFIISDIGMTSENEKTFNETLHNYQKQNSLLTAYEYLDNIPKSKFVEDALEDIKRQLYFNENFHENFMMFPISSKRMIVLISPYFKFLENYNKCIPNLAEYNTLTLISDNKLFEPNRNKYINEYKGPLSFHEDDEYIYTVKNLNRKDTLYCNCLFLDRIETFLGYDKIGNLASSIFNYKKRTQNWKCAKVNYEELEKIIKCSIR